MEPFTQRPAPANTSRPVVTAIVAVHLAVTIQVTLPAAWSPTSVVFSLATGALLALAARHLGVGTKTPGVWLVGFGVGTMGLAATAALLALSELLSAPPGTQVVPLLSTLEPDVLLLWASTAPMLVMPALVEASNAR